MSLNRSLFVPFNLCLSYTSAK